MRARRRPAAGDVVAVVFVGGCLGGLARYGATRLWPTPAGRFPWTILWVNLLGAFVLGMVVVVAAAVPASRYLRPLVGTGVCGGFTTFSGLVVVGDQLMAHGHPATGIGYLCASTLGGLLAAGLGVALARSMTRRRPARHNPAAAPEAGATVRLGAGEEAR